MHDRKRSCGYRKIGKSVKSVSACFPRCGVSSPIDTYRRRTCAISRSSKCGACRDSPVPKSRFSRSGAAVVSKSNARIAEASTTINVRPVLPGPFGPAGGSGGSGFEPCFLLLRVVRCRTSWRGMELDDAFSPSTKPDERPPYAFAFGLSFQRAMLMGPSLALIPTIIMRAANQDEIYLSWTIFALLMVTGPRSR